VNYPGKGLEALGSAFWRRPLQVDDALRKVRSENQAFQHRTQILQRRRKKRFL
jgi:hypothetical protein